MLYSLTGGRDPVTLVIVKLDGVEQGRLTGDDLRQVAGSYFTAPTRRGSYQVSVSAATAAGCEDGAARPMTLVVQ